MNPRVSLSPDNQTIHVFIPVQFGRRSGRKRILSPAGQPVNPDRDQAADANLINALVRAHRWDRWLEEGKYSTIEEIASAKKHSPSHATKILRLTLLAPDIQEAILNSTYPTQLTLKDFLRPFSQVWEEQREQFGF